MGRSAKDETNNSKQRRFSGSRVVSAGVAIAPGGLILRATSELH